MLLKPTLSIEHYNPTPFVPILLDSRNNWKEDDYGPNISRTIHLVCNRVTLSIVFEVTFWTLW